MNAMFYVKKENAMMVDGNAVENHWDFTWWDLLEQNDPALMLYEIIG